MNQQTMFNNVYNSSQFNPQYQESRNQMYQINNQGQKVKEGFRQDNLTDDKYHYKNLKKKTSDKYQRN